MEILDKLGWSKKYFTGWSEEVFIFNPGQTRHNCPPAERMEIAEFRRKYGLLNRPYLAFRKDGSWVTPI